MKKIVLLICLLLFGIITLNAQIIVDFPDIFSRFTNPSINERFSKGVEYDLEWECSDSFTVTSAEFSLALKNPTGQTIATWSTIATRTVNGTFTVKWTVPSSLSEGSGYVLTAVPLAGSQLCTSRSEGFRIVNPSPPVAVAATQISYTSFTANWRPVTDATGYELYVYERFSNGARRLMPEYPKIVNGGNTTSRPISDLGLDATSFTNLEYRLKSILSNGEISELSNIIEVQILKPIVRVADEIYSSGFRARWQSVPNATGYRLYVLGVFSTGAPLRRISGTRTVSEGSTTSLEIEDLPLNIQHQVGWRYTVRAVFGANEESYHSELSSEFTLPPPLSRPTGLNARDRTSSGFTLRWNAVSRATHYRIDLASSSAFGNTILSGYNNRIVNGTSLRVTGLNPGNYYFRVRAVNSKELSVNSISQEVTTVIQVPTPVALAATETTDGSFVANWETVSGEGVVYLLDVALDPAFTRFAHHPLNDEGFEAEAFNASGVEVNDINPNQEHYYRLRARIGQDFSDYSNVINVRTLQHIRNQDDELNWVETSIYNQQTTISKSKTYFDQRGRLLQTQVKNLTERKILANQPVYDEYDRPAVQTLSAPINLTNFVYHEGFVTHNGATYGSSNITEDFPDRIDTDSQGTLGWYYSTNNTLEPNTPVTDFPFSRSEYYDDGTGEMKSATGPGDVFHTSDERKSYSKTFPVLNDLDDLYLDVRNFLTGDNTLSLSKELIKIVNRDPNGVETVAFQDASGSILASGYADLSALDVEEKVPYNFDYNRIDISDNAFFDFHVPVNGVVTIENGTVTDLNDNQVITGTSFNKGFYRAENASFITQNFDYYNLSFNFYDNRGRMILSIPPLGVKWLKENEEAINADRVSWDPSEPNDETIPYATYYEYDFEGRLLSMKEPDAGITKYIYREDGSIRFSENALQRERGHFSYTNYDRLGRPVESGEYVGTNLNFDSPVLKTVEILEDKTANGGIITGNAVRDDWVITHYDLPDENVTHSENSVGIMDDLVLTAYDPSQTVVVARNSITLLPDFDSNGGEFEGSIDPNATSSGNEANFTLPGPQEYVDGAVSYSENEYTKTWYSYDELGRVTWMATWYKNIFDMPKVIRYAYDFTGNVTDVMYQQGESDAFYHHYTYDADNRLSKVYASVTEINSMSPSELDLQATYEYYLHGPMKKMTLGNGVQETEYLYTIQGWLKSLNQPESLGNDAFAQTFHYFSGDYQSRNYQTGLPENGTTAREDQYTGNIAGLTWRSKDHQGGTNPLTTYDYTYDNQYQLKQATNGSNNFLVDNLKYDPNGNIQSLRRYNSTGSILHDLGYNYNEPGYKNQLSNVTGYAEDYTYDAIGQLIKQQLSATDIMRPVYDVTGKVEEIRDADDQLQLIYDYDDRGFRIRKKDVASGRETIYVRDASGQLLSTYLRDIGGSAVGESAYVQEETPVYGSAKLGFWKHQSGLTEFELKDHLGNVRAKVKSSGNNATFNTSESPSLIDETVNFTLFPDAEIGDQVILTFDGRVASSRGSSVRVFQGGSTDEVGGFTGVESREWETYSITANITVSGSVVASFIGHSEFAAADFRNIRAVLIKEASAEVTYFADYYPFGEVMREGGIIGRYGYQGDFAEKDEETEWNHFELREYDPVIGRPLSIDPARQFYSPYAWVGNNPIIGYDPTGGICPKCPKGSKYDGYRNDEAAFNFEEGVGAFLDIGGVIIHGNRIRENSFGRDITYGFSVMFDVFINKIPEYDNRYDQMGGITFFTTGELSGMGISPNRAKHTEALLDFGIAFSGPGHNANNYSKSKEFADGITRFFTKEKSWPVIDKRSSDSILFRTSKDTVLFLYSTDSIYFRHHPESNRKRSGSYKKWFNPDGFQIDIDE